MAKRFTDPVRNDLLNMLDPIERHYQSLPDVTNEDLAFLESLKMKVKDGSIEFRHIVFVQNAYAALPVLETE